MDDVSVSDGTTELLMNGDFESGSFLYSWTINRSYGGCSSTSSHAAIVQSSCRTGSYCLRDGCNGGTDAVSQSFLVTSGNIYYISFWLKQDGGNQSGIVAKVTLS